MRYKIDLDSDFFVQISSLFFKEAKYQDGLENSQTLLASYLCENYNRLTRLNWGVRHSYDDYDCQREPSDGCLKHIQWGTCKSNG